MDAERFDRIAKQVSTGTSRRAVLKAAAAAAVGGVLAMGGRHEEALANKCAADVPLRCGHGCYDPSFSLCCRCDGTRGRALLFGARATNSTLTCSDVGCRD
jgi:hypothetical protein